MKGNRRSAVTMLIGALGVVALLFGSQHRINVSSARAGELPTAQSVVIELVPGWTWEDGSLLHVSGARASMATGSGDVMAVARSGSRKPGAPSAVSNVRQISKEEAAQGVERSASVRIVAGVDVAGQPRQLRPVFVEGAGITGTLISATTRQPGLLDLVDLAPTALQIEGRGIPKDVVGRSGELSLQTKTQAELSRDAAAARFYEDWRAAFVTTFVSVQVIAYAAAIYFARRQRTLPGHQFWAIGLASVPLALGAVRLFDGRWEPEIWRWSALSAVALAIIGCMSLYAAKDAVVALRRVLLATMFLAAIDLLLAGPAQISGMFGSSSLLAARYYGLGNVGSVILLVGAVLLAAIHVKHSAGFEHAILQVGVGFLLLSLLIGLPGLGADVGGLVSALFTGCVAVMVLSGRRVTKRFGATAVIFAMAGLAAISTIDYLRPASSRTHLGSLVSDIVGSGLAPLVDVVSRKIDANIFGYGFPWTLGVVAAFAVGAAFFARGAWQSTFPKDSVERKALGLAGLAAFVSYAVNDSGIVVLVVPAVFVGPFVMVVHRAERGSTPELEVSR